MTHKIAKISKVMRAVVGDYLDQGGEVRDGDRILDVETLVSPSGALPALMYSASQFYGDWDVPFADIQYGHSDSSYTGFVLSQVESVAPSFASMLLCFTNYIHDDVFNVDASPVRDLSALLVEFTEWCRVQQGDQMKPVTTDFEPD